ncbi:hypothetical protein XAUB_06410 [Xanthomonas citri pv. aurantifolii str. ICPB 11122]|nr:hypothetical protein XAUB_06410 [Xanthomonas citri pv. aurantifolii str. ICPB 11122]
MPGFIVERVGVGGAEEAAHLLATAVVAVVHGHGAGAAGLGHAAGGVVGVLARGAADGGGVAGGVVAAGHASHCAEAVAICRVGVGLCGCADLGAEAVAGGVIAVAVDQGAGAAVLEAGEAAQGVVAQADLRRRIAGWRQCGEVAGRIEAKAHVQPTRAGVLDRLRAVVQIVLAGEGAPIAVGPAGSGAERVVSGIAQ